MFCKSYQGFGKRRDSFKVLDSQIGDVYFEKPSGKIAESTTEQVPISTYPAETASRLFSNFRLLELQKTKHIC